MKAITFAFEQFKNQVEGRKIIFYTDHEPLVTADRFKDPMSRLGRGFNLLSEQDYSIHQSSYRRS